MKDTATNRPNEFGLIAKYFAPLAGEGSFGLLDDAALLRVPDGKQLVVTQDALAAGVHFFADDPPQLIAKKALRVNISDLVAKGATPLAYSLALGLNDDWSEAWIAEFARGLGEDQTEFEITLTGGDTFRSPGGTMISVTAFGLIDPDKYISRLGACAGDTLFTTGTIGDAALGLEAVLGKLDLQELTAEETNHLINAYLLPQPTIIMADIIGTFASASMDISDGLLGDLEKLCAASGVGAYIECEKIPLSQPVKKLVQAVPGCLESALTGGDDYQLLFTIPTDKMDAFLQAIQALPTKVSKIGVVNGVENGVRLVDRKGEHLSFDNTSYQHF